MQGVISSDTSTPSEKNRERAVTEIMSAKDHNLIEQ
jgi:hypothetical protein